MDCMSSKHSMATTVCEWTSVNVVPFCTRDMPSCMSHCGMRASLAFVVVVAGVKK